MTLEKLMQGVADLKPGARSRATRVVSGGCSASINSFLSSFTGWISPETWFSWYFKVSEAGDYAI